jgi:hypothetical protein
VIKERQAVVTAVLILLSAPLSARAQAGDAALPATSESRQRNLQAYVELLRSDLRTAKIAIITEVVQFTDDEDGAFWPVYREYEFELSKQTDDRLQLIDTYAQVYTRLTDAAADDLVVRMLDLETRRTALKQRYYARLKAVLPARTAARVIQVENQIQLLVDLQIAATLPVARDAEGGAQ